MRRLSDRSGRSLAAGRRGAPDVESDLRQTLFRPERAYRPHKKATRRPTTIPMSTEPTAREPRAPDSLSTRVCLALADADDVHPWESRPLYGALDPSVLEALESQENRAWRLEFEVGTHAVAVTGRGDVVVDGVRYSDGDFRRAIDALDDWTRSSSGESAGSSAD